MSPPEMTRCQMELCPNWSGDGRVCPCALFDLGPCEEIKSDECGQCGLEADHFGPCQWPGDPENNDDDT